MPDRETFLTLKDYIEQKGGREVTLDDQRRGHPRIYFRYLGMKKFLVIASTSSDFRAIENAKSTINELFTFIREVSPHRFDEEEKEEEVKIPSLELPQTFGERLQYAREQQQLTRERLSDLSGIDEELIQRFEVSKQETLRDFTTALLLSSALKTSLAYLVGEQHAKEFRPMTVLGEAISRERQRQNMSLNDLSTKAGMPIQQLANIETGLFTPPPVKIDAIAKALQVRRNELTRELAVQPIQPTQSQPEPEQPPPADSYRDINTRQDFAPFLRFLRERKGLTQTDLAKALGVAYPADVSRAERGLWSGGLYMRYVDLAKALGVPINVMKEIIERVKNSPQPASSQEKPEPRDKPEVAIISQQPVLSFDSEKLATAIREQGEITRALLREQHRELLDALKNISVKAEFDPAELMHRVINNIFK